MSKHLQLFLLLVVSSQGLMAQDAAPASSAAADLPREIIITPTMSLKALGQAVIQAEENLFGKFNELNDDDDYNINCFRYTHTGTHIPRRVCVPKFLVAATAENAGEVAFSFFYDPFGSPFLLSQRAMVNETSREYEILQAKMEKFAKEDPVFRAAAQDLIFLQREIKARRNDK